MANRAARFEESVAIIRQCWTGEPFTFNGDHFNLQDVQILPKPYQQPSPPLWIGASVTAAVRRAGRLGDAFVSTPSTTLADTMRLIDIYRQAAQEAGREQRVVLMRDAWVADSQAEAEAVYGPEVMAAYRYYWENQLDEFKGMAESDFTLENVARDRIILGDPEACIREFHRWGEATGAEYALLRLRHAHSGGPSHDHILSAIRKFGEGVIPYCS